MIFDPQYPIYIFNDYVDMKKSHNTLAYIVTHKIDLELMSGALFLFVAKSRKTCKALFFDGNGLVLIHEKIERGRFMSFDHINEVTEINSNGATTQKRTPVYYSPKQHYHRGSIVYSFLLLQTIDHKN